ncbi:hypothetical protein [Methylotenera sp. N17]|uniref:hypothetical protein n=1 Tax=Methylotenera sp. N17 TaxID=1502761 RepID=UPI000AC8EE70|nr:hypothetical protein [Methylotenera sp. N17]
MSIKLVAIQREKSNSSNMGPLVKNLIENIYTTAEKIKAEETSNDSLGNIKEEHVRTRFNIETTPEYIETRRKILKDLVDERNHLVHHIFSEVNHESIDRYIEIDAFLDDQRERIVAEHEYLRVMVNGFAESSKAQYDFINSPAGIKQVDLMFIQQSNLVQKLVEIALNASRQDGWTSLANAGNEIKQVLPGAFDKLKEQFGFKTFKDVLLASELFDLLEEETNKGGKRWFYKLKADEIEDQST